MVALPTEEVERDLLRSPRRYLAALDEVGRGAIAGPVTVGAVLIPADFAAPPPGLRDSKLLSPAARERLVEPIRAWVVASAIGHASAADIDEVGIMAALGLAARRALAALPERADIVLLDGTVDFLRAPTLFDRAGSDHGEVHTRAKADRDCVSVAAASILAKVTRDRLMGELSVTYPQYGWDRNKGYGTADHHAAIIAHGATDHHRRSWRLPEPGTVHNDGMWSQSRVPEGA